MNDRSPVPRAALWFAVALLLVWVPSFGGAPAWADDVDDAAGLPADEAVVQLEALLEATDEAKAPARRLRLHAHLAALRLAQGEAYAALEHLEVLARVRKQPVDCVSYAEALVTVARANMQARSTAAGVVPYLQDALAALDLVSIQQLDTVELAGRYALAAGEAYYILRRYDDAVAALERVELSAHDIRVRRRMLDLLARSHYAAGRYREAAEAFEQAGNPLGAAAAYDAANMPEKSVPIYAEAVRARPDDAVLLERVRRAAQYTGAEVAMLAALDPLPTPTGAPGVALLLLRADLLEAAGRSREALAPLRDAAGRDPKDPRASARLGRLLLLTEDVENEDTWDAAAKAYMQALRRAPEDEAAANGLFYIAGRDYGLLWKRWRDPRLTGRCVRVQRALVEARPDDALSLSNLANTLRVLGDRPGALQAYAQAREANPYDPGVRSDQGLALSAAGRQDEALAAYEASIELDAGHLAGRQNAARSHWLRGEDDAAAAHLGAAIRTARAVSRGPGTYRFLLDRVWRTRRDPGLR